MLKTPAFFCSGKTWIYAPLFIALLISCEFIRIKEEKKENKSRAPVARVHDTYLYLQDIKSMLPRHIKVEDSIKWAKMYINKWVKEQLFTAEALKQVDIGETEIEKKVADFRNSLVGYEFRKLYVQQNLVGSVSQEDIETYYTDRHHNFVLKQDIIKGTYIKVPHGTPKTNMLKTLIYATDEKNKDELKSYCISFSAIYYLSGLGWIEFDKLILNSPLEKIPNKALFLQRNSYYETKDDDFLYFLKIDDYRITGDPSPLEFVEENIKDIIINKRKVALAQQQEKEIYENAIKNKDVELYTE